mmetsp:Transcript_10678/g.39189  ORF Transcript_10678/g.39189 Transcript_10678/m.39189 type:complete len:290 (+) Transcript_10678:348-1217(+)
MACQRQENDGGSGDDCIGKVEPPNVKVVGGHEPTHPVGPELRRLQKGMGQYGCEHYRRRCRLVVPCCNDKVYWCRHCHNSDTEQHKLVRNTVQRVVCALCDLEQPVQQVCEGCGVRMGEYFCSTCKFFDDDLSKGIFHCDDCGICRVGGRENFFHCKQCGCCVSISMRGNHACVEGSMMSNCPICFEYLFDSVRPIAVLRCGHTIHEECFKDMTRHAGFKCPICNQAAVDMEHTWQYLDEEVIATPMPDEYKDMKVDILCNDCQQQSQASFHVVGLKCVECGSYNTRRL